MSDMHPLDQALALRQGNPNTFNGRFTPAYGNMVGPYGGAIAAAMLNAALQHADRRGDPLSLTVNYAAPIADADFDIEVQLTRNNRSTQHFNMTLMQAGEIAITASCIFASRRDSWSDTEATAPEARAFESMSSLPTQGFPAWVANYDMRLLKGMLTLQPEQATDDSTSLLWVRDKPPRPLDFLSLTAISDCFFPRIFLRRQQLVPTGTITLTTYFHVDAATLAKQGDAPVLAQARANRFNLGYFDQSACLWGSDGELLATSHQLVYFKA